MSGPEQFTRVIAEGGCARTIDSRQTLGAEAFERPSSEQSNALWQKFHTGHPALNQDLDAPARADLSKLETAALTGDAQAFSEVVKASQSNPSADGALKAFQRELSTLRLDADASGNNLFAQPDGKLARLTVGGGRVQMQDTGVITFNLDARTTNVDECGKKPDDKPNGEMSTLSVQTNNDGRASVIARQTNRDESLITDPAAFFSRFSPVLQRELEREGNNLL